MKIVLIAGARPNFVKIAPLVHAMQAQGGFEPFIVHTGQHYDDRMSKVFFDDLEIPPPDINLGVGSGSHAQQTARVMSALEPVLADQRPDWVLVVGDVNSTVAAALTAVKMGIRVGHVEAGLRSGDRSMPEEINRLATDAISDLLFTPSRDASENLRREGHPEERIAFVGNVMVDTLMAMLPRIDTRDILQRLEIHEDFILVTLHRPANVDSETSLRPILAALGALSERIPIVLPLHPRTERTLHTIAPNCNSKTFKVIPPLGYLDCLAMQKQARLVITDSGGMQEETTTLGTACLTIRETTERPITITEGTNRLVSNSRECIEEATKHVLQQPRPEACQIEGWEGKASYRILHRLQTTEDPETPGSGS